MLTLPTENGRSDIRANDASRYAVWVGSAKPGWKMEYHTGNLAYERIGNATLNLIGQVFGIAARLGLVTLTQRRISPDECTYIATRTALKMNGVARASLQPPRRREYVSRTEAS